MKCEKCFRLLASHVSKEWFTDDCSHSSRIYCSRRVDERVVGSDAMVKKTIGNVLAFVACVYAFGILVVWAEYGFEPIAFWVNTDLGTAISFFTGSIFLWHPWSQK